jgi:PAS domain S-box-containing protein
MSTSNHLGTPFPADATRSNQVRLLEATLSSIPDFVYAFDRQRRFAYANPAMLALFGLPASQMLGKTFDDLDYPADLASLLNGHIDRIFADGTRVEGEVFYRSPTGYAAYFSYHWGPVVGEDGSVELVIGVSRDTSERRAMEEALRRSEARLRAATELVGIGIYSWEPATGALDWDDRLRAMWGLPADAPVDLDVYEAGIHPDDLPRVRDAIIACADPAGDGRYSLEYRVVGQDDGVMREIATAGRATFEDERPVGFIGAAIDVTRQRRAEAAIRASEAQFQSFAANSSNLIWIGDPTAKTIIYRNAAFERIWGIPVEDAANDLSEWIKDVHPDDRQQVEHALATVTAGEVSQFEYRLIRPADGVIRWLRDTSFPIFDDGGAVARIGGIIEDLTQEDLRHVYVVSCEPMEARKLANVVRGLGFRARIFESAAAFLDMAAVLTPGCVIVDLRSGRDAGLSVPRELRARSIILPTIVLDAAEADVTKAVAAMKAGASDYILPGEGSSLPAALANAIAECHGATRAQARDESAAARIARLTPREREVLVGLVDGGTNKVIGQKLGISPRTVELHRAQVMHRLDAGSLTELLQVALSAGIVPSHDESRVMRRST